MERSSCSCCPNSWTRWMSEGVHLSLYRCCTYVLPQVTQLLEQGGSAHPDVIEAAFTALSTVFKHLARHLSADLPAALRVTAGLRYSEAAGANVRAFAAQVCSSSVSWDRVRPTVT